MHRHVNTTNTP